MPLIPEPTALMSFQDVSDVELAFPALSWYPTWASVPDAYKARPDRPDEVHENARHDTVRLASRLFAGTVDTSCLHLYPRLGSDGKTRINSAKAWRMVCALLGSYQVKHEHKLAAVAWCVDSFFEAWWEGDLIADAPEPYRQAFLDIPPPNCAGAIAPGG